MSERSEVPLVDQVAQAIVAHMAENGRSAFWLELPPVWHDVYRELARAIILSMREPTNGMIVAGSESRSSVLARPNTVWTWQAMIDAALSPPTDLGRSALSETTGEGK